MGKKGRKTRWRKLPIPIGEGGQKDEVREVTENHKTTSTISSPTFNNDEYTKITAPRQDMLFKKGYFVKKKSTPNPPQDTADSQSAGSLESDQYACEEPAPQYPYNGYMDPTGGVYYMNNSYDVYDPYYGNVTVVVGPAPQYGPGPHPVLAAVPCQPVPLQPLEWFNPAAPQPPYCLPVYPSKKKKGSVDSQSCSRQSSESTHPPSSPQESIESPDQSGMYMQPYMYPGYMFGAPLYNVNGVSVQGVVLSPAPQPADQSKRRKKRKRRMRGAVADEGSESSYEEVLSCEAGGSSQSGASSDTAAGSSSSKTTSDSGVTTDLLANSGSNSPRPTSDPPMTPDHFTTLSDAHSHVIIDNLRPYETLLDSNDAESNQTDDQICTPDPSDDIAGSDVETLSQNDNVTCDDNIILSVQHQEEISVKNCDTVNIETNLKEMCSSPTESVVQNGVDTRETESFEVEETLFEEPVVPTPVVQEEIIFNGVNGSSELSDCEESLENYSEKQETVIQEEPPCIKTICNDIESLTISEPISIQEEPHTIIPEEIVLENPPQTRKECANEVESSQNLQSVTVVADILASQLSEDIVEEATKEWSSERPITEAVTKWLQSRGTSVLSSTIETASEDEGIEEGEELTGQKNGEGNPFLAPSPSGTRTRVAEDFGSIVSSSGTWDIWQESKVTAMCDPKASVNKYYRLAAEAPLDKSPSLMKTAVHISRSGPFPCGVCCIIQ